MRYISVVLFGVAKLCEEYIESYLKIWLQFIFGNVFYAFILNNCLGPEHGVLCILIVEQILIRALVVFSLLRASNYHTKKRPFCNILLLYSHHCYIELSILVLNILLIDIQVQKYLSTIVKLFKKILLLSLCYILNFLGNLLFSKIYGTCYYELYFNTKILQQTNKIIIFGF